MLDVKEDTEKPRKSKERNRVVVPHQLPGNSGEEVSIWTLYH